MTPNEFEAKWSEEAVAMRRRKVQVDGAALCDEMLADFRQVMTADREVLLNLTQAAAESGYTPDHLGSLVRSGVIPNAGRPKSPKIRRSDLPLKPSGLRPPPRAFRLDSAGPGRIVRAVVASNKGESR